MKSNDKDQVKYIIILFGLSGLILLIKLANLQLFDNTFRAKGNTAAIDKQVIYPERGLIYDRNGELLVYNALVYDLMVTHNRLNPEMDTAKLCQLLNITQEEFESNITKDWTDVRYSPNIPYVFMRHIDPEVFAAFQEHLFEFPGISIQRKNKRIYPHENAAHALGYIREVDREMIEASAGRYKVGDYVGASGIEKQFEELLKGTKGIEYVLKDNIGRKVGPYKDGSLDSIAQSGYELTSSMDLNLQAYGELLMGNKIGSIVAIEPTTGEILSMISAPTYDPNALAINKKRGRTYHELANDTLRPLIDRSIMARYPPGSIFKTILSLIGLQDSIIKYNTGMSCTGAYTMGKYRWGCREHPRPKDVATAIQWSCNTYYFQLFRDIIDKYGARSVDRGLDELVTKLQQFGMGVKLGVDLPNESLGFVPNSEYYNKMYGKGRWRSSTVISAGIGQGELLMNTLQMANVAAIIANRGYYYQPHIIRSYTVDEQKVNIEFDANFCGVDEKHFAPVIEGMENVVRAGAAYSAHISDIPICGKTGTSQNPHGDDHSVFIAFAPKDNPKIAIAVYVENSGYGSRYAAPIASLMIEKYLTNEIRPARKWVEDRMLNADLRPSIRLVSQ